MLSTLLLSILLNGCWVESWSSFDEEIALEKRRGESLKEVEEIDDGWVF